jgi:hypothetical protein
MSISYEALPGAMYVAFILVFFIITFAIMKIAKNRPIIGTIRPIIRNYPPKNSNTVAV